MGFPRLIRGILSSHDVEPAAILGGLYTLVFGLGLLKPGSTFATSYAYDGMARLAAEEVWGLVVTALGCLTLWGIAYDVRRVRLTTSMLNCAFWCFMAILIGLATNWAAAGVPHFVLMGVASGWVHLRLADRRG